MYVYMYREKRGRELETDVTRRHEVTEWKTWPKDAHHSLVFFSSTVSETHHWATVLHETIVLGIKCDSGVASFQVQERSFCLCRVRF